jgi:hypothetical protein
MFKSRGRSVLSGIAFCCLLSSGCIQATVYSIGKYDAKADSIRLIQIYTNIRVDWKEDLDHLVSLWERRNSIIIQPTDLSFAGMMAFERKEKNKFCLLDLGHPPEGKPETQSTTVDLDSIKVIPGEFYCNAHGNLGYYHQIVVPGKTFDAFLKEITPRCAEGLATAANKQIELARNDKLKRLTWGKWRESLVKQAFSDPELNALQMALFSQLVVVEDKNKDIEKIDDQLLPWDMESLRLLSKAATDKSFKLTRNREKITGIIPLSKKDCGEIIATFEFIQKAAEDRIKAGKPVGPGLMETFETFELKYVEASGLEISVDIPKLIGAMNARHPKFGGNNFEGAPRHGDNILKYTVAWIQARKIPINNKLSIKDVVSDFLGK